METDPGLGKTIFIQESFSDKTLTKEDFSGKRLIDCAVQSLMFHEGRCRYLRARNTRFKQVSLDHVLCDQGYYQDCRWEHVCVRNSLLTGCHFSGCTFEAMSGELSSFGLSSFSNCRFRGSKLSEVSFSGSWWHSCLFEQENYFFVRFPSSVFIDTRFAGCRLQKAIFRAATFIRCSFEKCTLGEAVFHKARFIDTRWIDTDIHQASNLEEVRYD
jgi:uncharacterized protein YjbI with pentapeptide repeats